MSCPGCMLGSAGGIAGLRCEVSNVSFLLDGRSMVFARYSSVSLFFSFLFFFEQSGQEARRSAFTG